MSVSHKSSNTQIFRLMLYRRALHPELFDLQQRRVLRHGDYEVEAWVVPSGHAVRFTVGGRCLTETVLEHADHLPELGLVHALPCLGEKDYEMPREPGKPSIGYVTTIQTESLTENLYTTTMQEIRDFADTASSLIHTWKDEDGAVSMSMLDMQKYKREFHIQSYHLTGNNGLVLRTQSIFEVH